jgi:hypothetical protein
VLLRFDILQQQQQQKIDGGARHALLVLCISLMLGASGGDP